MTRPRRNRERGAALVEFTVALPVLAMLIFGGLSAAQTYSNKLSVVHAAREGARYGATLAELQCSPSTNCGGKTWAQLVRSVVVERADGTLSSSQVCVSLVYGDPGAVVGSTFTTQADGSSPCFDDGNGDPGKRVQVSINRSGDSIDAVLLRIPVSLKSRATARFEE